MAKPRWLVLLEEHERQDIEMGRVYVELGEMLGKLPPGERGRVKRFIGGWFEGKHTLDEAKKLVRELKGKYGAGNVGADTLA